MSSHGNNVIDIHFSANELFFFFSFSAFDEFYMIFSSFANLSCSFLIFARQ